MELIAQTEERGDLPAHVYRACVFLSDTGRHIRLLWSDGDSVLLPITTAPTTALFNFVGALTFGCAYPSLTFRRRGFRHHGRDLDTSHIHDINFLRNQGAFDIHAVVRDTVNENGRNVYECERSRFLCPYQGRFFGDNGSVVHAFAPHRTLHSELRGQHHAPYGFAPLWRFSTTAALCDGPCATRDALLPYGIMRISVLLLGRGVLLNNVFAGWRSLYANIDAESDRDDEVREPL